jgi:uncharacterized protein YndB with AHSA1/START domain
MATSAEPTAFREETLLAKTGKGRSEWHAILDAFGCKEKGHKATADFLNKEHGVSYWWSQQITIDYERAKGIREVGQRHHKGFAVNVTRTIEAPVEKAWSAWANPAELSTWFTTEAQQDFREGGSYQNADKDKGVFKKIVPNQRLEFTWDNEKHSPGSIVIVEFMSKGPNKTTVAITHDKLADSQATADMKIGWTWALTSLKSYLETGKAIRYEEWEKGQEEALSIEPQALSPDLNA